MEIDGTLSLSLGPRRNGHPVVVPDVIPGLDGPTPDSFTAPWYSFATVLEVSI
jgi:hypothetical protein